MSKFDEKFKEICNKIIDEGVSTKDYNVRAKWADGTSAHTLKISNVCTSYDLRQEFPILTLRKTPINNAVDELLWIWQKQSSDTSLLKSRIWDAWAREDGTIGAAYGAELANLYQYPEGLNNQVDHILHTLTHNPMDRRMIVDMFNQATLHDMALAPCCHHVNLVVVGNRLDMLLKQRSQDMAVANSWNVSQYAILLHMFAKHAGLEAGILTHVISDCHIYDRHIPGILEMLEREPFEAPKLVINNEKKDFYSWTPEDFVLENYQYGAPIRFEVAE